MLHDILVLVAVGGLQVVVAALNHFAVVMMVLVGILAASSAVLWPNFRRQHAVRRNDRDLLLALHDLQRRQPGFNPFR